MTFYNDMVRLGGQYAAEGAYTARDGSSWVPAWRCACVPYSTPYEPAQIDPECPEHSDEAES